MRSLVGIGSRRQDLLDDAVIRSNTSYSDNRLNSEKQEAATVLVALIVIGRQIWFVATDLISAIFWAKYFLKSLVDSGLVWSVLFSIMKFV